ncbi:MAG: ABC transporter ATP-binding protein [Candidatus Accumulibacter sp.]|jgi:ABC-2 type transport system ATP-binding protein|nr:ABC transporter ATP-binding protein [Accumulibacter sp.]
MDVAVSIRQISKRFASVQALDGVCLEIGKGEFFGLLGPNGAGKTTLISCLAGLVRQDSGQVEVMGFDVQRHYREARRQLGVVPQELVFDPFFSVRETLRIQSGYFGLRRNDDWIDEVLENLDLTAKAETNMRSLSGGMKRRVLVAQALVHKPRVIVLDEPTAGVDVELRHGLWQFVQRLNDEGHTVILTTHYLEEAEALCGRIAMLKQGRVVALDSTRKLLQRFSVYKLSLRVGDENRLPGAVTQRASPGEGYLNFQLGGLDEVEPLLAAIRESGCPIEDMRMTATDLEDVFVEVMRGQTVERIGPTR